jgi:hypothetical protein
LRISSNTKKISLQIKNGTTIYSDCGMVVVDGNTVLLNEHDIELGWRIRLAYCMVPGETLRLEKEGAYVVD